MLNAKPSKLVLTLIITIAVIFNLTEANDNAALHRRDNRLIKIRSPQGAKAPASPIAGAAPQGITDTATSASATPSNPAKPDPLKPVPPVDTNANPATIPTTPTSTDKSVTATSTSTTPSTSSSSATSKSSAPVAQTQPVAPAVADRPSQSFVTSTAVASPEATTDNSPHPGALSKTGKTITTVIIAIAASVGGIVILWTIIRKWKFSKSDSFDDRMQPIDWQPTMGEDGSGIPGHRRASIASSFHSGSGHDHNQTTAAGYGSTDHSQSLGPLPDHDFTAGAANLAPVGGYADLARGPSPQPQMQEAYGTGPVGYGAQDAYDYHGGAGARY